MKEKIKFYFSRLFFDGIFFTLALLNTTYAFAEKRGWLSCVIWILLTIFWLSIICVDFCNANKLVNDIDKVEPEDSSILGGDQPSEKAKLEKTTQDAEVKDE